MSSIKIRSCPLFRPVPRGLRAFESPGCPRSGLSPLRCFPLTVSFASGDSEAARTARWASSLLKANSRGSLERYEHIARWIELTESKQQERKSVLSQCAKLSERGPH